MKIDRKIRRCSAPAFLAALLYASISSHALADPPRTQTPDGQVRVGHEPNIMPAVNRYTGMVTGLGSPDAQGRIYSFQAKPVGPKTISRGKDDLRGWKLTMLAGERFSSAFEVRANSASEITVLAVDGPLNGIAVNDVFVVEEVEIVREPPSGDGPSAKQ